MTSHVEHEVSVKYETLVVPPYYVDRQKLCARTPTHPPTNLSLFLGVTHATQAAGMAGKVRYRYVPTYTVAGTTYEYLVAGTRRHG